MNEAFFTLFEARLAEFTADLRFLHKPSGELRPPQIVGTALERPAGNYEEGQEYPLVLWAVHECEFARRSPASFSVVVDGGIYTGGSIMDGTIGITQLALALGRLVDKPWYRPYKLRNRPKTFIGDQEKNSLGRQPHPYHYLRMYLEFAVATGHGG